MAITHYLTIQVSKRVLFDPDYGVVRSLEPLSLTPYLTVKPLCLFGISVDNLPLKLTEYHQKDSQNISLSKFLKDFWDRDYQVSGFNYPIITGMPDILVIDHRSKDVIQNDFYAWLELNNIQYRFSDNKDKKAIAKFRQHQDFPYSGSYEKATIQNTYAAPKEKYALSLEVVNDQERIPNYVHPVKKNLNTLIEYEEKANHPRLAQVSINKDVNLRTLVELTSKADRQLEDAYWVKADLETGQFGYLHNRRDQDIADSERYEKFAFLAAIKSLPEIQKENIFNEEQVSLINQIKKERFKDTICIDESNFQDMCYRLGFTDGFTDRIFAFDVSQLKRSEIIELWSVYSGGGDVQFSCELLLPPWQKFRSDKTYRFFYLYSSSNSIFFVCEPESASSKAFDNGDCLNHMTENVFSVRQVNEKLNTDAFDEMLLHNRQYLVFMALEMIKLHSVILDFP